MKDNKSILNEAFFKKAPSYEESKKKRLPQYSPVDLKKSSEYTSNTVVPGAAYQVTDTDEVKRRLSGAFGVAFGNNNIRSMASRAIKEFPIVISDAVEPETAIMIKKLVEEQYAEYIHLLISNQVVNLADYRAGDEDGNIAIQALDTISGSNFKRSRVADKAARTGNVDADTVFQNVPLYNLLRENQMELKTGDSITDTLLENAIVIPSSEVQKLIEFYDFNSDDIAELLTESNYTRDVTPPYSRNVANYFGYSDKDWADGGEIASLETGVANKDKYIDLKRGFHGLDDQGKEIYSKLTTGDIVIDEKRMDQAINRSVGELLANPENEEIRKRFEKATYLLQSRRISGLEYYQYLTMRLGIPVSDTARLELVRRFKIGDIRKYGQGGTEEENPLFGYTISKKEVEAIAHNRIPTEKVVKDILKTRLKDAVIASSAVAAGAGVGALAAGGMLGTVVKGAVSVVAAALGSMSPFLLGALAGAAVGGGAILIWALIKKIKKKKADKINHQKIQGWERVESLIIEMEKQQNDITGKFSSLSRITDNEVDKIMKPYSINDEKYIESKSAEAISSLNKAKDTFRVYDKKDYISDIEYTNKMIQNSLRENVLFEYDESYMLPTFNSFLKENATEENITDFLECVLEIAYEHQNDEHLKAQFLTEKVLAKTSMPMTVKYVDKKPGKDVMVTPSFMARDNFAYGSVEIDRRDMKDRRYNQPLIMTVKFKERFDDGKYSDNELTAVIGILGRIIRIPSKEMEYVLEESLSGKTIEGLISNPEAIKDNIGDLFSTSKISKDLKNLPQSADVWRNLEKVTALAVANKMSAKRNGNVSNAHIVFSQKEVDAIRTETGVDLLKDVKKALALMKRYSAFTLMVANDAGQRMHILDDNDAISWNVLPYSALMGKDSGDQINAALTKMMRL